MLKLLALLLVVVAVVNAQDGSFTVSLAGTSSSDNIILPIGVWSDFIFVTADIQPQSSFTITINAGNTSASLTKTQLTFDQTHNSQSFQIKFNELGDFTDNFNVTFSNATLASNGQFKEIESMTFSAVLRSVSIPKTSDNALFPFIGEHSAPIEIQVDYVSSSPLSINLDSSLFAFTPNPVVIPANTRSAWFTYMSSSTDSLDGHNTHLNVTVSGAEASFYANLIGDLSLNLGTQLRPFAFSTVSIPNVVVGAHSVANSNGLFVYTRQISNFTFTITPQAADTQFFPTSQVLGPSNQEAFFSFNTSSPEASKTVFFYASGGPFDFFVGDITDGLVATTTINVPRRKLTVNIAGTVFVTNTTFMSVSIPAPVASSLTVTMSGGNVWFNTSSITFTGNTTSIVVALKGTYLGAGSISFALSGNDAQFFEDQKDVAVTVDVIRGNFIAPDQWYVPYLFVGQESDKIPIRASISPINTVTLTPYAANLVFNPRTLTFRNGTEQQYFTITPLYTNAYTDGDDSNTPQTYDTTINWFINGTDQAIFDPPGTLQVSVNPRYIQVQYSAHLRTANYDSAADGVQTSLTESTRYLHKTYKVWASVNYIGDKEHVSVTPVSPYYSFKPAVLFFDAKHTRIEYEATVTGIPPSGSATISYLIGGQDGGLYYPIYDSEFDLALRPLKIVAAVVAPDERIKKGVYVASHPTIYNQQGGVSVPAYTFNAASVLGNQDSHVESFLIRSFVLPDKSLKITPRSPHVTFSPSSITIKNHHATKRIDYQNYVLNTADALDTTYYFNLTGVYLEANFTAHAQAAGTHDVWFELSGDDADYYSRPDHIFMNFRLVMRPDSEPFRVSSSSFLFPSFVVVAAMAVFALAL